MRLFLAATVILSVVLLGGCARPPPVWTYYDKCAAQTSSFVAMVECGKEKRTTTCQSPETERFCGAEGTAFVQYADGLAQQVRNHEISDAVALQRFAEYKSSLFQGIRRNEAIVTAGQAAGGPRTCVNNGNTVNCF